MQPVRLFVLFLRIASSAGPLTALRLAYGKAIRRVLRPGGYVLAAQLQHDLAFERERAQDQFDALARQASSAMAEARQLIESLREDATVHRQQLSDLHTRGARLAAELEAFRHHVDPHLQHHGALLRLHADSVRNLAVLAGAGPSGRSPSTTRVSVIVPVYNRAHIVGRAIESVLTQSHPEMELIVVDDGSTDDIEAAMARHRHPALRFVRLPRGGDVKARNAGLKASTGDIIFHMDSDNRMCPGYLAALASSYDRNPDAQCGLAAMLWDDADLVVHLRRDRFDWNGLLAQRVSVDTNCFSYRRSLWQALGGWDESLTRNSDYELALRYTRQHPPMWIDAVAVHYDASHAPDRITTTRASKPNMTRIYARYRRPVPRPLRVMLCEARAPGHRLSPLDAQAAWMQRQGVTIQRWTASEALAGLAESVATFKPDLIQWDAPRRFNEVEDLADAHGIPVTGGTADDIPLCFDSERFYPRHGQDRLKVLVFSNASEASELRSVFDIAAACPAYRFVLVLMRSPREPRFEESLAALNDTLAQPVEFWWDLPDADLAILAAHAGVHLHLQSADDAQSTSMAIVRTMACCAIPVVQQPPDWPSKLTEGAMLFDTAETAAARLRELAGRDEVRWREHAVRNAEFAYTHHVDELVLPPVLDRWLQLTDGTGVTA